MSRYLSGNIITDTRQTLTGSVIFPIREDEVYPRATTLLDMLGTGRYPNPMSKYPDRMDLQIYIDVLSILYSVSPDIALNNTTDSNGAC
ncbi:Hypothetical predicted protein [Scomber scombrus]|uniref:Uncharacterized protein n=1 Tax=Scomber scombrus TaxID=13677 RepID=A0AAV1MSJ9_SCOSC